MTTSDTAGNPGNSDYPVPGAHPGLNDPSPTSELTALAAQLYRLADHVNHLEARVNELSEVMNDELLLGLAELRTTTADQLTAHTIHIHQLIDTATSHNRAPVDWAIMGADQAATEWEALASWIERTLVPWYELTRDQLPDCWALHRPAVIDLAWLHHTHHAAHRPGAAPHLLAEWHTRWKPGALHTIHDAIPRHGPRICGPGGHLVNEADRIHRLPGEQPARFPIQPTVAPTAQPAERRHWQHFYEHAVTADLSKRQQRRDR